MPGRGSRHVAARPPARGSVAARHENLRPVQPGESSPALTHGAYSLLKLSPRVHDLRDELRKLMPLHADADAVALDAASLALAQFERASIVLEIRQGEELQRLREGKRLTAPQRDDLRRLARDAATWSNTALKYLDALGLTPMSRVRLGLDLVRAEDATERLRRYLDERRNA